MEDYRIDIMIDQGPNARQCSLGNPPLHSYWSDYRVGLLTAPMRSRFTLQTRLDYYDRDDLTLLLNEAVI